ncbi:MAG: hypothetical protein KKD77_20235 [Gammaproteobacteria bacterium]|nr:hypothetical protein [Gammaproteobacteria bacterium]
MAGHPQNSPRGLFLKADSVDVDNQTVAGNTTGVVIEGGLALSGASSYMTQSSTTVSFPGAIKPSGAANAAITGSSSGNTMAAGLALSAQTSFLTQSGKIYIFPTTGTLPSTRVVGGMTFVKLTDSTGMLAYHATGTTWKYARSTSIFGTA